MCVSAKPSWTHRSVVALSQFAHLYRLTEQSTFVATVKLQQRWSLEVFIYGFLLWCVLFGQICYFKPCSGLERLHMCSLANPLTFRVQSKCIHALLLVCLYIMLCSIALTSHFPLGSNALCAVKLTLDMSLSVDEDRYYVPLRLYVSPRPLLKHMEEKAHGWREHDDGTCHPPPWVPCTA